MPRSSSDLASLDAHVFVSLDAFIRHKQIYIFVHAYSGRLSLSLWLSLCLCLLLAFACCFVLLLCVCFCCLALLCLLFRFYSALLCILLFFVFSFEAPSVMPFSPPSVRPTYASLVAFHLPYIQKYGRSEFGIVQILPLSVLSFGHNDSLWRPTVVS